MLSGQKIVVVMPAYNAARTLKRTSEAVIEQGIGDLEGRMPWGKYIANRFLTFVENFMIGAKLSEYHTGYRAFARSLLERIPIEKNSDDFVFDNQMLAQIIWLGCKIGEVTCPAKYLPEGSSINFRRSVRYGLGCLATALRFRLARWRLGPPPA